MRFLIYLVSTLFSISPLVSFAAENAYLCIPEESTGFYYDNGSWGRSKFNVSGKKYIIRKLKDGEMCISNPDAPYGVFDLGDNFAIMGCYSDKDFKGFHCVCSSGELFFSTESGRFIETYIRGYWDGKDNNNNTPTITRGRCSKF